ncbi:MAG: 3-keto-5-aminohexanoate cleavage protein [Dehalococcoidia bacterium]|nr:3-keto-5-aminohexanoate cleavage protein [Dehalococcoidia bacterium]
MDTVPLIVNFAPTGMIPTREMTSHVPLDVAEIVEDVHRASEVGITMVHVHARDEASGEPTWRAEVYERILLGIRRFAPEMVIAVSLSGRTFQEYERRAEPLSLDGMAKPDMGSLTLSSVNFNRQASINAPDMIQRLALAMKERGILPELEAFDSGMVNYAKYLQSKGLLEPPHYMNLLLGNIACAQADLLHAGVMVRDLPPETYWSFAGIGDAQLTMNAVAIAMGGGVRVGLEDQIWFDSRRSRLASNVDLLKRVRALADIHERSIMTPSELRQHLRLEPGGGVYGRRIEQPSDKH